MEHVVLGTTSEDQPDHPRDSTKGLIVWSTTLGLAVAREITTTKSCQHASMTMVGARGAESGNVSYPRV